MLLAADGRKALELFKQHKPKVVSLDLGLPPDANGASEGLRVLEEILAQGKGTKVVVVSGNEDRNNALAAITLGAYDFYQKPIDLDTLKTILARAFYLAQHGGREPPTAGRQIREKAGMDGHLWPMRTVGGGFFHCTQGWLH